MFSIQQKAQQEQAKETHDKLETAVKGLEPGSPERREAFKRTLDDMVAVAGKRGELNPAWDFSAEKERTVFTRDDAVVLRPVIRSDADFYVSVKVQYSLMYQGIVRLKQDLNEGLLLTDLCQPETFFCVILDAASGASVGFIGLKDTRIEPWEIGIELDGQYTQKGYGSRSIRLFLNEIHRITGKAEFQARVDTANVPSQKCFEKMGARLVGLCDGPFLKLPDEKKRFEDRHLDLIDDNMRKLALRLEVEPRKLLSHVLDYRLTCPI